jgi:putative intracellular protease/amidase
LDADVPTVVNGKSGIRNAVGYLKDMPIARALLCTHRRQHFLTSAPQRGRQKPHGELMSKGTVLVVASSADKLELQAGKVISTGTYLNETVVPVKAMITAGYDIVLATPKGTKPVLDRGSMVASHFGGSEQALQDAISFMDTYPAMQKPRSLRAVIEEGLEKYAGVFVPGGHAPVTDLVQDADLGVILRHFHDRSKPTAFLCHGPIAVIAAMPNAVEFRRAMEAGDTEGAKAAARGWQYAGYRMTIFSKQEEKIAEDEVFKGKLKFHVADALQTAGGILTSSERPFEPNVTRDRELITGQNPRSDHGIAEVLVKALDEQSARIDAA